MGKPASGRQYKWCKKNMNKASLTSQKKLSWKDAFLDGENYVKK